jgi:hypothetical protein
MRRTKLSSQVRSVAMLVVTMTPISDHELFSMRHNEYYILCTHFLEYAVVGPKITVIVVGLALNNGD